MIDAAADLQAEAAALAQQAALYRSLTTQHTLTGLTHAHQQTQKEATT